MTARSIGLCVLMAAGLFAQPNSARAGSLTNAALACYVDTYAFDQLSTGMCSAVWTPSTANNPTIAHFEVVGLTPGSYSFAWTDLDVGSAPPGCGNASACNTGIATETSGDGLVRMSVLITDNATGLTKTLFRSTATSPPLKNGGLIEADSAAGGSRRTPPFSAVERRRPHCSW